jgi:hypothetical protein
MKYKNISEEWGAAVEVTADDYRKQAEIFGLEVLIDECAEGIYIDGELVAELEDAYGATK